MQRSRVKRMNADQGATLFEFREKRDEFVPSPHSGVSRGEPKAKLLGGLSLVRFFVPHKEMNEQLFLFTVTPCKHPVPCVFLPSG